MSELLKDFIATNEINIEQILNNLINSDKNIALKTEIYNPKNLAILHTYAKHLKSYGYKKSYKLIIDFIEIYLKFMVSNKRKSRTEIIKALTNLVHKRELDKSVGINPV